MKYIKKYEKKEPKFKKDDIVICIDDSGDQDAKIIKNKAYKVLSSSNIHQIAIRIGHVGFWNNERFRLATTSEVNEYEAKIAAKKYNL